MTVQEQAFKVYYSSLTDAELMKIAANKRSFVAVAQEALANELCGRRLPLPEAPRAAEAQPGWLGGTLRKALAIVGMLAVGASCSSGPARPQPGTPAFFWASAREAYRAGDVLKTVEQLQRILATENEYAARARAWDAVISSGLTNGYIELAEAYEAGARMNRANPMPFRKQVSAMRSQASTTAIQFTEDLHRLMELDKDPNVLLAFEYPMGTVAEPAALKRVAGGLVLQDSERDLMVTAMLQRGVLLSVCRAVGNPDDAAAAQEKLKSGEYRVERAAFLVSAASAMQAQSELFTGSKLDQPRRLKLMSEEALEALRAVPTSKEVEGLKGKIQERLKKAGLTT